MAVESKYFVDVFGDIVSNVRSEYDTANNLQPYYMHGHPREIANRLNIKDRDRVEKFRKFPLIVLMQDFQEGHGDDLRFDYSLSFTVIIVTKTNPNYTSEERYANTFKPILYPLYNLLLQKMDKSPYLQTIDDDYIRHTKTDRLFWGAAAAYGNEGLIFNEYMDAIEINFTDLLVIKDSGCL